MKTRRLAIATLLVILSGLIPACGTPTPTPQPDQVTIQFNWLHTVEWAGFYAAQEQGFYADENLEVELVAGEVDPFDQVLSGEVNFGTATGTGLIMARSDGKPVIAVAAPLRQTPLCVMALAESGISTPEDLVGKTVGVVSTDLDTGWDIQFLAMLEQAGVDPDQINFVPIEEFGVDPLLRGEMDAMSDIWSTNDAIAAELAGHDVNLIFVNDYGVLEYPDPIFTSQDMIEENPDIVERFVRATLKGYQYVVEHPEEGAQLALQYNEDLDSELQTASMNAYVPLIDIGGAPIGTMDQAVWESTQQVLLDYNFITAPINLEEAYTNQFVNAAY